jgi:hypothetical protein
MDRKTFAAIGAIIVWFALLGQYYLIIENRVASIAETTVRFFTFFTIETNIIVAFLFTAQLSGTSSLKRFFEKSGVVTAITLYITIVGLVYQFILRQTWHPEGFAKLIDELLHSVMPAVMLIYWFLYEDKRQPQWKQIPAWLIFPALYLAVILVRGAFFDYYPYFFLDAAKFGYPKVIVNSALMVLAFSFFAALFVVLAKGMANRKTLV